MARRQHHVHQLTQGHASGTPAAGPGDGIKVFDIYHANEKINECCTIEAALDCAELCKSIGYSNLRIVRRSDGKTWDGADCLQQTKVEVQKCEPTH